MRQADWTKLRVDLENHKDIMTDITTKGKKATRELKRLKMELKKDEMDYSQIATTVSECRSVFNVFSNFLGNVVYPSEDDEAIKKYDNDMKALVKNVYMEKLLSVTKNPNRKMGFVNLYDELENTLEYMYIFLKKCREVGFGDENIIEMMKLLGGRQTEKKYTPPTPEGGVKAGSVAKGGEEEEPEFDSGLELFKNIQESLEGS